MTMIERFRRAAKWSALLVLPGLSCTCANAVYDRAYAGAIQQDCDAYRHAGGITAVRDDAIELVSAQGFAVDPAASSTAKLQTSWREEHDTRTRIIVELDEDSAGTRARATRSEETLSPPRYEPADREPAPEIAADVVRRLVPTAAEGRRDEEIAGHVFELPARVLAEEAARVLADRGELVEFHAEGEPMHTTWRDTVDRSARTRFEVHVVEIDATHRRLDAHVERERMIPGSRKWQPGPSRRDLELELALVDRRDPTAAAAIRSRAETEARAAYDAAIERGAPSCGL
jgi:hypothetical protein